MAASKFSVFLSIMAFYIVLSYVVFPLAFFYAFGRSLKSAGNGFVVGSVVSVILWCLYGSSLL